jgi:hypothetical protein
MTFKNQAGPMKHNSWTVSKLNMYDGCPAKAKYKHLDKLPEPDSPAMARGGEVHAHAEQYVTGREKKLADELQQKKVKSLVEKLKKDYKGKKVRVEMELAFNRAWKPCHWLAKDVYVRFKIDVVHFISDGLAVVIDWKTGKFKPEHEEYQEQLHAYCTALLSSGLAKKAKAMLVFTDSGDIVEGDETFELEDLPAMQQYWDKKAKPFLSDTKHAPRPGNGCRWCPYSTNKGGPCRF